MLCRPARQMAIEIANRIGCYWFIAWLVFALVAS